MRMFNNQITKVPERANRANIRGKNNTRKKQCTTEVSEASSPNRICPWSEYFFNRHDHISELSKQSTDPKHF